jgi:hypothetical protein
MTSSTLKRIYPTATFLILLSWFSYFIPTTDWNSTSRAALVFSIVNHGLLNIDQYHEKTGDKAFFEGHYYSDKPLGPILVAVPVHAVYSAIGKLIPSLGNRTDIAIFVMNFFATAIPSALLGTVIYQFTARFARQQKSAFLLALVYGLGTIALPYSMRFYQHQLAAFGMFVGFFLLWRVIYEEANQCWLWVVGLLFGLTVISEYPTVPFLGTIFLWAAYKISDRWILYRVVLGALPFLLISAAYNLAILHTPLPAAYLYHVTFQAAHRQGFMGITGFSLTQLWGITFSPFRGLFFISPVLLLTVPGLYWMWQQYNTQRGVVRLLAGIIVGFFLYNASYLIWWGGWAVGPRFLLPMLPFMILPLIFPFERLWQSRFGRIVLIGVIGLSIFGVTVQTLGGQSLPPDVKDETNAPQVPSENVAWTLEQVEVGNIVGNPLLEFSLPKLIGRDVLKNYGTVVGLTGFWSLLPILVINGGISFIVFYVNSARQTVKRDT